MKEYNVLTPSLGFRNRTKNFETILNDHAREDWTVKSIVSSTHSSITYIVFERNKNR